jgi:endonuclease/exonuclease/phosphatase (EEP) superfamily protein YafD
VTVASSVRAVGFALLPWTWFLWRDLGGGLDGWFLQTGLDLFALFLPLAGTIAAAVLGLMIRHSFRWLPAFASVVAFTLFAVMHPWQIAPTEPPSNGVRIVFANLLLSNESARASEVLADAGADLLITAETNGDQFVALTSRLGEPIVSTGEEAACSLDGPGECAALNVWSRHHVVVAGDQSAAARARGVRLEVTARSTRFVVYAVHPRAPSPFGLGGSRAAFADHRDTLAALLRAVRSESLPTIVTGDLNLADRASGYRDFTGSLRDAMRTASTGPTALKWYLRPLFLRVDHLFIPRDWCSADPTRIAVPGADHRAIAASVGPCAAATA